MLRAHPERYACTGLDWGNAAHRQDIAAGLFQVLMSVLARRQGLFGTDDDRFLRQQQARIEQRLMVAERAVWRDGHHVPLRIDDANTVYALEKMADAIEEGALAHERVPLGSGSNVFAGTMLGLATGFAASVRGHGALTRYSIGPRGALTKISDLITRPDVRVEMEDLPEFDRLVSMARAVPAGDEVCAESESCVEFLGVYSDLEHKVMKRDRDKEFGC